MMLWHEAMVTVEMPFFFFFVNYCDVLLSCLGSHFDGTHSLQIHFPNLF